MPKPLSLDDFRAVRIVLELDDFGLAPESETPPSDLVDAEVWNSIQTLPDDVAVQTSNHYGRLLKLIVGITDAWVNALKFRHDPIEEAIMDVADEFQASTFNALHGYLSTGFWMPQECLGGHEHCDGIQGD